MQKYTILCSWRNKMQKNLQPAGQRIDVFIQKSNFSIKMRKKAEAFVTQTSYRFVLHTDQPVCFRHNFK